MGRTVSRTVVALLLCTFGTAAYAAGPVKIRPTASVFQGEKRTGFLQPQGVGCVDEATFFVADSGNGRLLRYTVRDGGIVLDNEYRFRELPYPVRLAAGQKGEIFALDGKLRRIGRVSPAGEFAGYVSVNIPRGESIVPKSFAVDDRGSLFLLDLFSERILVADPSGTLLRDIRFPERYGFLSDIAVDAGGSVFLLDSVEGRIHVARPDSKSFSVLVDGLKEYSNFPVSLALDGSGSIFVLDRNGGRIVVLGRDGSFQGQKLGAGWKEGFLRYPSQICIGGSGRLVAADEGNNRVQVFSLTYE